MQADTIAHMIDGIIFHLGDKVETVKGAKFWGEIIAFDTDDVLPGCTVRAIDPRFEGTKHVYPLKQLRHRPGEEGGQSDRIADLLVANNRYQQEAREARAESARKDLIIKRLASAEQEWGSIHQRVILDRAEALRENDRLLKQLEELSVTASSDGAVLAAAVPGDYFGDLVARARATAAKASAKFPQPNYVTLKIAEEAGEVVRGAVHYAENRMEWSEVEGEIVQLLAMLIRFVTEGDQVIGVIPPAALAQGGADD